MIHRTNSISGSRWLERTEHLTFPPRQDVLRITPISNPVSSYFLCRIRETSTVVLRPFRVSLAIDLVMLVFIYTKQSTFLHSSRRCVLVSGICFFSLPRHLKLYCVGLLASKVGRRTNHDCPQEECVNVGLLSLLSAIQDDRAPFLAKTNESRHETHTTLPCSKTGDVPAGHDLGGGTGLISTWAFGLTCPIMEADVARGPVVSPMLEAPLSIKHRRRTTCRYTMVASGGRQLPFW